MKHDKKSLDAYKDVIAQVNYNQSTGGFKWKARGKGRRKDRKVGTKTQQGYVAIGYRGVVFLAHRIAWVMIHGELPDVVDHINGKRDDNRIINLRNCTHAENMGFRKTNAQREERARKKQELIRSGRYVKSEAERIREDREFNREWEDAAVAKLVKERRYARKHSELMEIFVANVRKGIRGKTPTEQLKEMGWGDGVM